MSDATQPTARGRPTLPAEDRRCERVVIMVTADEHAALLRLSVRSGTSISSTCRSLVLGALKRDWPVTQIPR